MIFENIKITEHEEHEGIDEDCCGEEEITVPINIKYIPSYVGIGFGM